MPPARMQAAANRKVVFRPFLSLIGAEIRAECVADVNRGCCEGGKTYIQCFESVLVIVVTVVVLKRPHGKDAIVESVAMSIDQCFDG